MNHQRIGRTARTGGAGIGLLVILIGVVLGMWLLFGKTGPGGSSYMGKMSETKQDAEDLGITMQARQVALMVVQQELASGTYPESLDEIEDYDASTLVDQWDQPFTMTLVREGRSVKAIELRSPGYDQVLGNEDDVVHIERLPL
ncbi:MAG: hypothetical protein ACF8MJ_13735 [Phycisphaerales bacterium JB050]